MQKYISFDIEIAKVPTSEDWKSERPLGISCAATLSSDGFLTTWQSYVDGAYAPQMDKVSLYELVQYLVQTTQRGYKILGFNSLGFDFDILAEESGLHEACADLALNHVDIMFQFLCTKGFPVSLDALSRGMGLEGKTKDMSGAKAPQMWATGDPVVQAEVLDYVSQDVRTTLELARAIEKREMAQWVSRSGRMNTCVFPGGLRTVRESLGIPRPQTNWMTNPLTREGFYAWAEAAS